MKDYTLLLTTVRAVELIGAVLFSFGLLLYGIVLFHREYGLVKTWDQMKELIGLTNDAGVQADVAKGTLSLSRTRPGLALIGIGAALLLACILKPLSIDTKDTVDTAAPVAGPTASVAPTNYTFHIDEVRAGPVSAGGVTAGQVVAQTAPPFHRFNERLVTVEALEHVLDRRHQLPTTQPSASPPPTHAVHTVHTRVVMERAGPIVIVRQAPLTPDALDGLYRRVLDRWLDAAPSLAGLDLPGQVARLQRVTPDAGVDAVRLLLDKDQSPPVVAERSYGDARFLPLVRAFNPGLPTDAQAAVPAYTTLLLPQPQLGPVQMWRMTHETRIRIAGASRRQVYDQWLLTPAQGALASDEFRRAPAQWWAARGGVDKFLDGLTTVTGRKWGMRLYTTEAGETPREVARVIYGEGRFLPVLAWLNPDAALDSGKGDVPLPPGTALAVLELDEF